MGSEGATQLILLVGLVAVFYFLVLRPQRQRLRAAQQLRAALAPGDRIMTTSGLYAALVSLDGDVATLEIAPGVRVAWATAAIARILEPSGTATSAS